MPYHQRDLVNVSKTLPDGTTLPHPFLIISCRSANSIENYYTGVMMTASNTTDIFSFLVSDLMFESPLEKNNCQFRLYIIVSFRECDIKSFKNRMKKVHFKAVADQIKDYVLSLD